MNGIESPQPFLAVQLSGSANRSGAARKAAMSPEEVSARVREFNLKPTVSEMQLYEAIMRIGDAAVPIAELPEDIRETIATLKPAIRSFHGAKMSLAWFTLLPLASPCADKFGYMSSWLTRATTRLQFTPANQALLDTLGDLMADPGRETSPDSVNPAGFTYVGQFIDHDITFDTSSPLDAETDAETIHNMRTPALDLDSLYGNGPALQPFLYVFPSSGPSTAIKFELGTNRNAGPGGPAGTLGDASGMQVQTDFDVPRVHNPLNPGSSSNTAIIGDPRNDENLIVTQFHHAMLRFHNQVVDLLIAANFGGDIFSEAKQLVTHHYQWAVVHDFLTRICGNATVTNAINTVNAPINSPFRMPAEFAVAAYRFGHSMVRDNYWVSFRFPNATMAQVFRFARNPNLPVLSNWVVDFNAFFDTGVTVPMNNKARRIDSVLASELENLPGFTGIMKSLARRNLQRGLALGLPSGQGMAKHFRVKPMTSAQLTLGLPANEIAALNTGGQMLLKKTPLWYYVLREAAVLCGGDRLGPVGGRIVARTFVRMLKRDGNSFLNVNGGFRPILPSKVSGTFTFSDLLIFAGVTQP
ncbi:peroxidase family protein [Ensifer adhaerens]|uniref:peroxidase family protein n=1 Tax=Ensifer adhaerens TaxID=106592 RepID=UPI003F82DADE